MGKIKVKNHINNIYVTEKSFEFKLWKLIYHFGGNLKYKSILIFHHFGLEIFYMLMVSSIYNHILLDLLSA